MNELCQHCGASNPAAARFCRRCGRPFGETPIRSITRVTPLMQQWRKLTTQLTRKDVRKLLGEPARVEVPGPGTAVSVETWNYEYHPDGDAKLRAPAQVCFASDGRLLSWTEPPWNQLA